MTQLTQQQKEAKKAIKGINKTKNNEQIDPAQVLIGFIFFVFLLMLGATALFAASDVFQTSCTQWSIECIRIWTGW